MRRLKSHGSRVRACAAVAWADGRVSADEKAALLSAARECGLEGAVEVVEDRDQIANEGLVGVAEMLLAVTLGPGDGGKPTS